MLNERTTQFVNSVTLPMYDDVHAVELKLFNSSTLKRQVTFDQLIKKEKQYLKNWKR